VLRATCHMVRDKWNSEQIEPYASAINAYSAASEYTSPIVPMPALEPSWRAALSRLQSQVADADSEFLFEPEALDDFLAVVDAIENSEPRLVLRVGLPQVLAGAFKPM